MKNYNFSTLRICSIIISLLFFSSCKKDTVNSTTSIQDVYSIDELKDLFEEKKPLSWASETDLKFIYSVGIQTDSIYAIGFKPSNYNKDISDTINLIDLDSKEWVFAKEKIIDTILKTESRPKDKVILGSMKLPSIIVKVGSIKTLENLLDLKELRYIEPLNSSIFLPQN